MLDPTRFYYYLFGLITLGGGIQAFVHVGSKASLIAGGISGILLLVAGWLLQSGQVTPGLVVGLIVWGWKGTPAVAGVIALTITMAMTTAALLGVALPGALRGMRRDPRIAAGPIVLALTDFLALIAYFNVARWLLE